ncbi:hypothetical protein AFULGI_00015860 [Archaeoglobus fulgidus DSM 8774]|uniref:Uncharacterized protein n=1 Tax=Archaeoglobus fulgidus DSM 8774 TaxID=1344584 RepID=A0A075WL94_ARCFL|nr:hypothetical protein [Archaeoglobus fulgidus]AIG98348.1 hypothetical protein AFULGI_00015860 [Archaeoglobus fulgidus DSM 8774]
MKAEELAEVARKKLKGVAKEIAKAAVSKYSVEFFDPAIRVDAISERNKGYFISPALAKDENGNLDLFVIYLDESGREVKKKKIYEMAVDDLIAISEILEDFFKAVKEYKKSFANKQRQFLEKAAESYKTLKRVLRVLEGDEK